MGGDYSNEIPLMNTKRKIHCCDYCNYQTSNHHHLKDHLRVHTGERPFCCPECVLSFTTKSNLIRHMKVRNHYGKYTPL